MASGIIFFWICWMLWVIVTFFMKKDRLRTTLAFFILLAIICSNIYVTILNQTISITLFILLGYVVMILPKLAKPIYHVFTSFTIMVGYTAMLMWEGNAQIWLLVPRIFLISIFIGLLAILLTEGPRNQLASAVLGVCTGELSYNSILAMYNLQRVVGEMAVLDHLFITILFILCFNLFKKKQVSLFPRANYHPQALS